MAITIVVPRLGWTMDDGAFVRWLKQDGDTVHPGEMLFTLEGDKAAQDVESFDGGILRIPPDAPRPGDDVKVGQVLGYLVAEDEAPPWEEVSEAREREGTGETPVPLGMGVSPIKVHALPKVSGRATKIQPASQSGGGTPTISPRARRTAAALGIEWQRLIGTGGGGRIRESDVLAAAKNPT